MDGYSQQYCQLMNSMTVVNMLFQTALNSGPFLRVYARETDHCYILVQQYNHRKSRTARGVASLHGPLTRGVLSIFNHAVAMAYTWGGKKLKPSIVGMIWH